MLVKRLKLTNFVIFADVDLDLSEVGLSSIIGRWHGDTKRSNGSGKSALLEAIPYALFGTTRSKSKIDIVRRGSDKCVVEIELVANGVPIRIYRARNRDGTSSAKVWVNGEAAGQQIRDVKKVVERYLGVDQELFELIYFFRQDAQFGFVNASPGERKTHLARVLDLSAVESCFTLAKQRHLAAVIARDKAIGALDTLRTQLASKPTRQQLEDKFLDACLYASYYQTATLSRTLYLTDLTEDVSSLKAGLEGYDRDTKDSIEELRRLESEHNQKARDEGTLAHDLQANETLQDLAKAALADIPPAPETGGRTLAQLEEGISDASGSYQTWISKVATLDSKIASAHSLIRESNDKVGQKCPSCYQIVAVDHVEVMVKKTQEALAANVKERAQEAIAVGKKHRTLLDLQSEKEARVAAERAVGQVAHHRQTITGLGVKIGEQKRRLEDISIAIGKINERRDIISTKVNTNDTAERRQLLGAQVAAFSNQPPQLDSDQMIATMQMCSRSEALIDERDQLCEHIKTGEVTLKQSERDVSIKSALVDVFGKNGLQAILVENLVGVIQQFANDILAQMQTRFEVALRTQKETQAGEQRETLDIAVFDNGAERMFETYSGGERTLINLALRLALSRIVSGLHGVVMESLFLDEILAALDEMNRTEAIKIVAFLAKSFQQTFVISHTNEVKDVIGGHIFVERFEDHSTVSIHDGNQTKDPAA
tara:strand:+ start:17 stop:2158 length:2142 start_codon:yes stop_codon:yes gene_type:complete